MATNYKVLGQAALTAETSTDIYTVPADTEVVISTIAVCNRSATANSFRVSLRPDGATLANEHYLIYDTPVEGNDTTFITVGLTANAGDVVTVYSGASAEITMSIFGSEIS